MLNTLNQPYTGCFSQNLLAFDLNHKVLVNESSQLLGVKYLSNYQSKSSSVQGKFYGRNRRILVCLPVSIKNNPSLAVHFVVDTGSPITMLSQQAFNALLQKNVEVNQILALIWGIQIPVSPIVEAHKGINILGCDFFTAANIQMTFIYKKIISESRCVMQKGQ